jgi:hypothetical protein
MDRFVQQTDCGMIVTHDSFLALSDKRDSVLWRNQLLQIIYVFSYLKD